MQSLLFLFLLFAFCTTPPRLLLSLFQPLSQMQSLSLNFSLSPALPGSCDDKQILNKRLVFVYEDIQGDIIVEREVSLREVATSEDMKVLDCGGFEYVLVK